MSNHHPGVTETSTAAWERRAALAGPVDFTMMYVAHDAFNRDLDRLLDAVADGRGHSPAVVATWQLFSKQLHTHHSAEDTVLWPRLRAAVTDPDEHRILDDMEAEHASLDPRVEQINAAIADQNTKALEREMSVLAKGLSAHMIHEESQALPLLERRLGKAGWDAFSKEIRDQQGGIKGAADYLPWLLDGATEQLKTQVLRLLPAPARVVYRRVWEPKYRKAARR